MAGGSMIIDGKKRICFSWKSCRRAVTSYVLVTYWAHQRMIFGLDALAVCYQLQLVKVLYLSAAFSATESAMFCALAQQFASHQSLPQCYGHVVV